MRLLFLAIATVSSLAAQTNNWATVQALSSGTEVRVTTSHSETVQGLVESVTADLLVVNANNTQRMFARPEIIRVAAKKKSRRGRHTLIGLGIGAAAGFAIGAAGDSSCSPNCFVGDNLGKEVFTPLGALVGLIVGVVLPAGGWQGVYRL